MTFLFNKIKSLNLSILVIHYRFVPNRDPIIKLPVKLQNMSLSKYLVEKQNWDNNYQNLIKFGGQRQTCYYIKKPNDYELNYLVSYPQNLKEYRLPESKCRKIGSKGFAEVYDNKNALEINTLLMFTLILSIILIL